MDNTSNFFEHIFNNAKANAILIMSTDGFVHKVNEAFTTAYGYTTEDLQTKHFRILYLEKDQITRRPEIELNVTHREGASSDENYLVHKDGTPIWVTGESILIKTEHYTGIVKIIHNIHAQKQLERYLLATSELLDSLFESAHQSGLLILDAQMKAIKANGTFNRIFGLTEALQEGTRLQQIGHAFWKGEEIKNDIRNSIVSGAAINKEYMVEGGAKGTRKLQINSKLLIGEETLERRVLLMIKES